MGEVNGCNGCGFSTVIRCSDEVWLYCVLCDQLLESVEEECAFSKDARIQWLEGDDEPGEE